MMCVLPSLANWCTTFWEVGIIIKRNHAEMWEVEKGRNNEKKSPFIDVFSQLKHGARCLQFRTCMSLPLLQAPWALNSLWLPAPPRSSLEKSSLVCLLLLPPLALAHGKRAEEPLPPFSAQWSPSHCCSLSGWKAGVPETVGSFNPY